MRLAGSKPGRTKGRKDRMDNNKFDAQLHLLRSAARAATALNMRAGHEAESARFNLFAALQAERTDSARNWLRALEVSLRTADLQAEILGPALDAMGEIRAGLEEDPDAHR